MSEFARLGEKLSVNKLSFGTPEKFSPSSIVPCKSKVAITDGYNDCCFSIEDIKFYTLGGSAFLQIPLKRDEDIYGLGLMFKGFKHTRSAKRLKVNSDPVANTGDSHAPVPFYVSTLGYGVLVDSARVISFSIGNTCKKTNRNLATKNNTIAADNIREEKAAITSVEQLYERKEKDESKIIIEIPKADGATVFVFSANSMLGAVSLYNLYCGGGSMPPRWGLSMLYRCYGGASQADVIALADSLKNDKVACDVIGLEPGWQSHAYSCSLKINEQNFNDFSGMIDVLKKDGYHVNLWQHIFLHSTSPLYEKLYKYSGDYEVWEGIVPDFTDPECEKIFMDYMQSYLMDKGIDGFKIDECDDADYSSNWSFPSYSRFPKGLDGEQMHNVLGALLQNMFDKVMKKRNTRYYSQVRSGGANVSSFSFALYTDLYAHSDYVRGVANCGFSGLLFSPEVRQCDSEYELIRRLELSALAPQCCVNAWMIPLPPWKQYDINKNISGELLNNADELTVRCKQILDLRLRLEPLFYSLFYRYNIYGEPPVRALVMNYPNDVTARQIDNQFMLGENIVVAPLNADKQEGRHAYLPRGEWYDYFSGKKYAGEQNIFLAAEGNIGVFVKRGTLLALNVLDKDKFKKAEHNYGIYKDTDEIMLDLVSYGERSQCELFEDDGETYNYLSGDYNIVKITVSGGKYTLERTGKYNRHICKINSLKVIK